MPASELLPGTLEMLILRTLTVERMHGYAIAQHVARTSHDVLKVEKGSLYPALERLQRNGRVTSKWAQTPTGRKARYYTITASGRRMLGEEINSFEQVCAAIARVLYLNAGQWMLDRHYAVIGPNRIWTLRGPAIPSV